MKNIFKIAIVMAIMMSATFAFGQSDSNNTPQGPVYDQVSVEFINLSAVGHSCACDNEGWEVGQITVEFIRPGNTYSIYASILSYADHIGPLTITGGLWVNPSFSFKITVELMHTEMHLNVRHYYYSPMYFQGTQVVIDGNNFSKPYCCFDPSESKPHEDNGPISPY